MVASPTVINETLWGNFIMMIGKKLKRAITTAAIGAAILAAPVNASAHTIAVGTTNGGAPGAVDIYFGSYHGSGGAEGSITIGGFTFAFGLAGVGGTELAPGFGLTEGSNLFYSEASCCVHVAGLFTNPTNNTGTTIQRWQVANVTGLSSGWYNYQITGMNTAVWRDWNSDTTNWAGSLFIPESSVTGGDGVPAPAALGLFGFGLAGLGFARRRRSA